MMKSENIREIFLQFFEEKKHKRYPSSPIVVHNDPTLMFTNAGMNQFKDFFLGNENPSHSRIANSQKCLRVSGKHNDLEEVGVDHYHHTMFEMLGNWSFGDYFKQEAIEWAWELLTKKLQLNPERMYVTVFEGDTQEQLDYDKDSFQYWTKWISKDRILNGNKKDNFWEMGETGPCGPCTEIHFDMRSDEDRKAMGGHLLVNRDHPEVIEIWNLVFMEFNRLSDGSLHPLPNKHVDTGMGFERLCRVIQQKKSNYDTDIFTPLIHAIETTTSIPYQGTQSKSDIAFRVMADHIRAISFCIADGQLPSNNGAGYVIRRILRRAVRYAYSFLHCKQPLLHGLIPIIAKQFEHTFPEINQQSDFIQKVIKQEELSFLNTLDKGIQMLHTAMDKVNATQQSVLSGKTVFELYDTFGFPSDLTRLIASEHQITIDEKGFQEELTLQQERSRLDAQKETGDWIEVHESETVDFCGYDLLTCETKIIKYRTIKAKGKMMYQVVFTPTPFYPEGGGQVGDRGHITGSLCQISYPVIDTKKENNLILHILDSLPETLNQVFTATVNPQFRNDTSQNHSATHLLHAALRQILGPHVTQKGSQVNNEYLRFDFSHFTKTTTEELRAVETLVNQKIRDHITLSEVRDMSIDEAIQKGAMALFGEKYGDKVRVITFDPSYSIELCGGTHVTGTAQIGLFKIVSESAVAAGVRRIEAITAHKAFLYLQEQENQLIQISNLLQQPKELIPAIEKLKNDTIVLRKKIEAYEQAESLTIKNQLANALSKQTGIAYIIESISVPSADALKNICFQLKKEFPNSIGILGCMIQQKPIIAIYAGEQTSEKIIHAGKAISRLAKHIKGGGGGQPFYATAGGSDPAGLSHALDEARVMLSEILPST
jgi:alanyl-tRNA synthetase